MEPDPSSNASRLIEEIIAISQGECTITDASIQNEADPSVRELLFALLMLNEDLEWQRRERTEAQHAEQAMSKMLNEMLSTIDDAIFSAPIVPGGRTFVSPGFERIYGRPREAFLLNPMLWLECIHPDDRPMIEADQLTLPERGKWDNEHRVVRRDGTIAWVRTRGKLVRNENGEPTRLVGVTTDISERKRLEAELLRERDEAQTARREAEAAKEDLASASRMREELMAFLVHDINNQLSVAVGNAEYLADVAGLKGDLLDAAVAVHDSVAAMRAMVANLLDISRAENGALIPVPTAVNLRSVLESVRQQHLTRRNDITIDAPDDRTVATDRELVRRIVENLTGNALKHTKSGNEVRIEASIGDAAFELCVRDRGPGIPVEHRERIFERYVRLASQDPLIMSRSRGLGLAFCRLATESLGGRIWVEDNNPTGSVFRVSIPAFAR
ncbi:MAG: PAS domain-containing sensor histidine kinase [Deltaproteobacteria bacterium]|nr:PAS domain-containing sensor histidine kinase [Deltaproteobacteria bacterium]